MVAGVYMHNKFIFGSKSLLQFSAKPNKLLTGQCHKFDVNLQFVLI